MSTSAYTRKKNMAAKLAAELAETRALQPRLKREMYERQAKRSGPTKGRAAPTRQASPN